MTTPENNIPEEELETTPEQELPPIIPPIVFLIIAAAGFLVAITVASIADSFNIIGWTGLAVAVIALFVWAFMFPEEIIKLVKGRSLTFGGLGLVVTAILVVASVLVYIAIADGNWSRDFSERDVYSLDVEVREVLNAMGEDPSIPTVHILGFYNATSGGDRDRIAVLLQDMINNSGGKIVDYEFIDPVIENIRTQTYLGENPIIPSIVIAAIDEETAEPSTTRFEVAVRDPSSPVISGQFQIINAILSLSVEGDFRAYILDVEGSLDTTSAAPDGANGIVSDIDDEWTVETLDPLLLQNLPLTLNDPAASAEVMIIPGGTQPLSDAEVAVINDYVQNGGDLIVLGDINTDGGVSTAVAENFSNMLWENFGVRLRDDLVIDPANPVRPPGRIYLVNNYGAHSIVAGLNPDDKQLVMSSPHSIEISDTPPAEVSLLVSTGTQGYVKTGLNFSVDLTEEDLALSEDDLTGEIPLAVVADNTETGARLVLAGSADLMQNEWRAYSNIEAPEVSEAAIYWVSEAQNFSDVVRQLTPEPPEPDQPIFITAAQLRWMSYVMTFVIPFGMLIVGGFVWMARRPGADWIDVATTSILGRLFIPRIFRFILSFFRKREPEE